MTDDIVIDNHSNSRNSGSSEISAGRETNKDTMKTVEKVNGEKKVMKINAISIKYLIVNQWNAETRRLR